jgi:signal transduction histidine kinase
MNNGGSINVNLSEENNSYVVGIRDTGNGIHQDIINKIFNPFFSTKDKGSGLGLPIVKNIIEAHNGEIRINSDPDSGTEVIILLPKK